MKVYTRKGDDGKTHLYGGSRVRKTHPRLEAYGSLDETNSWLGLLRDICEEEWLGQILLRLQSEAFVIGAHLATVKESLRSKLPAVDLQVVSAMETAIDRMDEKLPPLRAFILPGGHPYVSYAHIARTVCRRAERHIAFLVDQDEFIRMHALPFLNRLSDFLFVLSRYLAFKMGVKELEWIPRKSSSD